MNVSQHDHAKMLPIVICDETATAMIKHRIEKKNLSLEEAWLEVAHSKEPMVAAKYLTLDQEYKDLTLSDVQERINEFNKKYGQPSK